MDAMAKQASNAISKECHEWGNQKKEVRKNALK